MAIMFLSLNIYLFLFITKMILYQHVPCIYLFPLEKLGYVTSFVHLSYDPLLCLYLSVLWHFKYFPITRWYVYWFIFTWVCFILYFLMCHHKYFSILFDSFSLFIIYTVVDYPCSLLFIKLSIIISQF